MLLVPVIALMLAYGFCIFRLRDLFRTPDIGWLVELGGLSHSGLAWPGVLIVVMVGFHEAMSSDGTLARMARTKGSRIGN